MSLTAHQVIEYVSDIRYTTETSLGQMLAPHEYDIVRKIVEATVSIVNIKSSDFSESVISTMASYVKLLTKEAPPSNAVILMILYVLKTQVFSSEVTMKYKSLDSLLGVYPEFSTRDVCEQMLLIRNANWMHILFLIIPAKVESSNFTDI